MNFKKMSAFLLAAVILFNLSACGKNNNSSPNEKNKASSADTISDSGDDFDISVNSGNSAVGNTGYEDFDFGDDFDIGDDFELNISQPSKDNNEGGEEEEIVLPKKTVNIKTSKVVNSFYDGIGGNIVPYSLMTSNIKLGYNDSYFAVEKYRMNKMKLNIVRLWVQVDWMEKKKGVYDFDTMEMNALCKYISALKDIGTDVQLTFGWKVGSSIQDWYSIPGLSSPYESAPADLDAYAKSCSAILKYLWGRGYNNVKHLTFANEPNGFWDWECYGDQCAYYASMVKKVDAQLKKDGIRNKINIWACEEAGSVLWCKRLYESCGDAFDSFSFHSYEILSSSAESWFKKLTELSNRPIYLSEFSTNMNGDDITFYDRDYCGVLINGAKSGMSSMLNWCVSGVKSMSTTGTNSWEMSEKEFFWDSMLSGGATHRSYYQCGLINNYIDRGSKVVSTETEGGAIRSATFISPSGDITVLAELNSSADSRNITLKFDKAINKTFYKYIFTDDISCDYSGILPGTVGTLKCGSSLYDSKVEKGHSLVIYTTKAPVTQISLSSYKASVKKNGELKLTAGIIDGSGSVVWSVEAGKGTVTSDGKYKPDPNANSGDMAAVRASLESDRNTYAVCLVTVK